MKIRRNQRRNWLLYPFSLVYGVIVFIRNFLYDYHILPSKEFDFPVISVGNITVGGTGKTPHIEYLIKLLMNRFNLVILSRGYKRKTGKFILAEQHSTSLEIGDEPRQIKQKFPDITVAVEKDRVKGVKKLRKLIKDLDIILLDDAFQHRSIKPGVNILLVDYHRLISKDYLLPFGRLREPAYETCRANIIIVTKCPDRIKPIEKRIIYNDLKIFPYQNLFFTQIIYGEMKPVFPVNTRKMTKTSIKKEKPYILLVTGIANPRPFKRHVRWISTKIKELSFRDHHYFSKKDLLKIADEYKKIESPKKIIMTTEKDAMRFQNISEPSSILIDNMYYIPIEVSFKDGTENEFNEQIIKYVKKNKKINSLFKR